MRSRYDDAEARNTVASYGSSVGEDLALRVYTSRLLGQEPALVLAVVEEHHLGVGEPALRATPEVHDDLDEGLTILERMDGVDDLGRQGREQRVEVVDRFPLTVLGSHADLH